MADQITIFAASSLRDALGDVTAKYEAQSGHNVVLVFAASSVIARQVEQGAPADVVLLADEAWGSWLIKQGAVSDIVPFAGNRLVMVGRDAQTVEFPAFIGDKLIAFAQVEAVPAGRYGKAALVSLGLWDGVAGQIVQAANVRAALRFVERGEIAFGIGYASDLMVLPTLREVYAFAPDTHPPIVYSSAQITAQGSDFMDFLQSVAAQDTLVKWGFSSLPDPT